MELDRSFTFRGSRNYLHSASVLDDLLRVRPAGRQGFDFRFERRTANQVRYQDAAPPDPATLVASWRDGEGTVHVVERDEPIAGSVPYDEDGLARNFEFLPGEVRVPAGLAGYTTVEAVIAAFKALLREGAAGPDVKVVFVRMRCSRLPALPLSIRYARKIGDFYQGDLHDAAGLAGQIYYGEWR